MCPKGCFQKQCLNCASSNVHNGIPLQREKSMFPNLCWTRKRDPRDWVIYKEQKYIGLQFCRLGSPRLREGLFTKGEKGRGGNWGEEKTWGKSGGDQELTSRVLVCLCFVSFASGLGNRILLYSHAGLELTVQPRLDSTVTRTSCLSLKDRSTGLRHLSQACLCPLKHYIYLSLWELHHVHNTLWSYPPFDSPLELHPPTPKDGATIAQQLLEGCGFLRGGLRQGFSV